MSHLLEEGYGCQLWFQLGVRPTRDEVVVLCTGDPGENRRERGREVRGGGCVIV